VTEQPFFSALRLLVSNHIKPTIMKGKLLLFFCLISSFCFSQDTKVDSAALANNELAANKREGIPTKVFYSQRLINANTVEILPKGILAFRVVHNFNDAATSKEGGLKNFFGLDFPSDAKIAFQLGVGKKLNLLAGRTVGNSVVAKLWELGLKYQFLQQMENDPRHPFSLSAFANVVAASSKKSTIPGNENSFENFGDRFSEIVQLMIARKFGGTSLQLSPTYFHRAVTIPNGDKDIFALGAGLRLPLSKRFSIVADYFVPFFSHENRVANRGRGIELRNPSGIGIEILTFGHVFHLNFTNAREILENKFIPRTFSSWTKGEFRWSFILERNFTVFRHKNK
jgi:hypothetical protein